MSDDDRRLAETNSQNPVIKVLKVIWKINMLALRGLCDFFLFLCALIIHE